MLTITILAIALLTLFQFTVYSWRAALAETASARLTEAGRLALECEAKSLQVKDFAKILGLQTLCPDLTGAPEHLWSVRSYFSLVQGLKNLAGRFLPVFADWSERELATCTRYVAIQMDQRLQRNRTVADALFC